MCGYRHLLQGLRLTGPALAWSRRSHVPILDEAKQSTLTSRLGPESRYTFLGCVIQGQYPDPEPCSWGTYLVPWLGEEASKLFSGSFSLACCCGPADDTSRCSLEASDQLQLPLHTPGPLGSLPSEGTPVGEAPGTLSVASMPPSTSLDISP